MRMALGYLRTERSSIGAWPVAYLAFFSLHNSAESTLLTRTTFEFLVFVTISVSLQQAALRQCSAQVETTARETDTASAFSLPSPVLGPSEISA
jgi:hypothetical protein